MKATLRSITQNLFIVWCILGALPVVASVSFAQTTNPISIDSASRSNVTTTRSSNEDTTTITTTVFDADGKQSRTVATYVIREQKAPRRGYGVSTGVLSPFFIDLSYTDRVAQRLDVGAGVLLAAQPAVFGFYLASAITLGPVAKVHMSLLPMILYLRESEAHDTILDLGYYENRDRRFQHFTLKASGNVFGGGMTEVTTVDLSDNFGVYLGAGAMYYSNPSHFANDPKFMIHSISGFEPLFSIGLGYTW